MNEFQQATFERLQKTYETKSELLSVDDVAEMLKITRALVLKLAKDGFLTGFKLGNKNWFPKEWVLEYMVKYGLICSENPYEEYRRKVLKFCGNPKFIKEISLHLGINTGYCKRAVIKRMCAEGCLKNVHIYKEGRRLYFQTVKRRNSKKRTAEEIE